MRNEPGFSSPFHSEVDAARSCALEITDHLARAHRSRGRSVLAVCGGRSAALVLPHLTINHAVTVIAADERWLPLDSLDRNDQMLIRHFGESSVVRLPFGRDVSEDAKTWARHLWNIGTPDVVLLSMADDGHVASLFPQHDSLKSFAPLIIERDSPKPPLIRVSLSIATIRSIPNRLLMAIGNEKASMIDQVRQGHDVPATRIKPTRWYLDSAASSANGGGR